ncbi:FtsX-like permease family protein [Granulicatella sp. zg-ZJ]|uniref:permease-like cell division protein FtsX n=1 Tax=unclassified Granulicatella TaxID=2630493 RepID=UPI0013C22E2B|nr:MULTISPECIES: permease-like cell division protein FtsX [unclassified Granulicatella]MBS4750758.1 permease-like cell division protein FtsX [Carnobacteriaceae bacterium zg-ZUI78]NEW62590.1 FtsX-like permease family protein [Granulicatella sp. zg-ZJ]NEW66695.1 FtsX-like permease family protein [Granulicatella sp. zg-84]QMI85990.1 ABC transporter permease [Carnobacteriaceae bacterium zg-84]
MIRMFFRHIKEALQSVSRNFVRSLLSIITVGLTLLLVGIFASVLLNVSDMAQDATNSLEVKVFVDLAATKEDEQALERQLKAVPHVQTVIYSSKDEQLSEIIQKYPSFSLFKEDSNPLRDAYIVMVDQSSNIKDVTNKIRELKYVYKANDGGEITEVLVAFSKGMQFWGGILIVSLVLIAVMLIMNTIRATILSRQTEIEIMRLVGATKWFIRWPFLLEGAFIGLLGSVLPVGLIYLGYTTLYAIIEPQLITTHYSLLPPNPYALYLAAGLAALGILIGAFGSIVSIRRFLKK